MTHDPGSILGDQRKAGQPGLGIAKSLHEVGLGPLAEGELVHAADGVPVAGPLGADDDHFSRQLVNAKE